MNIELHQIPVRDIVAGYVNSEEEGVVGFSGKLNIRPKYQREFIYRSEQQIAVINSVMGGFPLNAMYWVKNADGSFEILDGQQRTVSICNFLAGDFNVMNRGYQMYFDNLSEEEKEKILSYTLMVYFCEGSDEEKLAWFKVINTAGEKLTSQELLNAIYSGPWVTDAKRYFSKSNAPAYLLGHDYMSGALNRQEYLETVLRWISGDDIEGYMGKHQQEKDAEKLWEYFQNVMAWVQSTFPTYRREMAHVEWGGLYNEYKNAKLDPKKLEKIVAELMQDDDVTKKPGIYTYVLDGQEKHLSIRAFKDKEKREAYERQGGVCAKCGKSFAIEDMEADHITSWSKGGKTNAENCQMLCREDNRRKSGK